MAKESPGPGRIIVLGLLTALGPLSIDLYLPALPVLKDEFAASDLAVQLTLAGMTLGLALGQLTVGIWSDRIGRRRPLLISTGLHVAATVGCALAPTIGTLIIFRVVQGIGAAGSAVLVLAIVRDIAEGRRLVVLLSRVTLVTTTVPLLAPVGGAELLPLIGWRGIFAVLVTVSVLTLIMTAATTSETHPTGGDRRPLPSRIRAVLADRRFRSATVVAAMTYAGVYAYVAAAPLLLEQVYGLTPRAFAVVFLINSLGLVLGVQLASVSARKHDARSVLLAAVVVGVLAAAAILPLQWLGTGLLGLLPCLWVFIVGCGACFPCAEAIAFDEQGAQAGTATSVHGFVCFAVAGLVSPLPGLWGIVDPAPVAGILLGTSVISLITVIMIGSVAGAPPDRGRSSKTARPSTMKT